MSSNIISRFQENFKETDKEREIASIQIAKKSKDLLVQLFQLEHQKFVIEKDIFTNRPRLTNAQMKYAEENAHTMIPVLEKRIDEIKEKYPIRDFHERLIDGIKGAIKL